MFCLHCGTENAEDSKFCKECGTLVGAPVSAGRLARPVRRRLSPFIAEDLGAGEPVNPQLHRHMEQAQWHSQAGNLPGAILSYETALLIDPDNISALSLLGCLYERQGEIDKAINVFERVVQINPDSEADAEKLAALKRGEFLPPVAHPGRIQTQLPRFAGELFRRKPVRIGAGIAIAALVFGSGIAAITLHGSQAAPQAILQTPTYIVNPAPSQVASGNEQQQKASSADPDRAAAPATVTVVAASSHPIAGNSQSTPPNAPTLPGISHLTGTQLAAIRSDRVTPLPAALGGNSSVPSISAIKPLSSTAVTVASVAGVPEHTVVVAPPSDTAADNPARSSGSVDDSGANNEGDAQPPVPASHVYVRVHWGASSAPAANSASAVPVSSPAQSSATVAVSRGSKLQSQALSLQQKGDYRAAVQVYRSALSEYRSEVDNGEFVSEAQRGIEACETGLQICQQSQ